MNKDVTWFGVWSDLNNFKVQSSLSTLTVASPPLAPTSSQWQAQGLLTTTTTTTSDTRNNGQTGPNDTRCVIWAQGKCFSFLHFIWCWLTFYCLSRTDYGLGWESGGWKWQKQAQMTPAVSFGHYVSFFFLHFFFVTNQCFIVYYLGSNIRTRS